MKAVVVGSGSLNNLSLLKDRCEEAELIIAADGGGRYLYQAGLIPHVLVGDFDSIPQEILAFFKEKGKSEILTYPTNKDYTDLELALIIAEKKGATDICLLGVVGSRFDHSMANIYLLYRLLNKNIEARIEDSHNQIYLIKDKIKIKKQENWKVSLLAVTPEVTRLTTSGLLYPLYDYTLQFGSSLGVSNEFSDDYAEVSFENGLLMVILSRED